MANLHYLTTRIGSENMTPETGADVRTTCPDWWPSESPSDRRKVHAPFLPCSSGSRSRGAVFVNGGGCPRDARWPPAAPSEWTAHGHRFWANTPTPTWIPPQREADAFLDDVGPERRYCTLETASDTGIQTFR